MPIPVQTGTGEKGQEIRVFSKIKTGLEEAIAYEGGKLKSKTTQVSARPIRQIEHCIYAQGQTDPARAATYIIPPGGEELIHPPQRPRRRKHK